MAEHNTEYSSPLYLPHHPTSSVLNRGLVELLHDRDTVTIWEVIDSLLTSMTLPPSDILEYIAIYRDSISTVYIPPDELTINFHLVRKYGLMLPQLYPDGVIFRDQKTISLTILQIKCLLCHMVLGSLPKQFEWKETSRASVYYRHVLFYYLSLDNDTNDRCVTCTHHTIAPCQWEQLPEVLHQSDICTGTIEDNSIKNKVVFSNKNFGPGPGGTQEELIFGSYPETCVFPLFFSRSLRDSEVVLISQVLRVAEYSGYGREVEFKSFIEPSAEYHTLLLMDALEIDLFEDKKEEFSNENITRELNKCFCGFSQFTGGDIATGRWGCGAFGGTYSLKKRIQQFAANRAKVNIIFCEI
ncbi:hypothetical protein LOD99_2041 [Oopsacas minuta]|uniref:PARG catalytic Macro domain-containing protein n=1 Tax=Oopsacas minuta TaxID=111878 RepID=A0AAV7K2Y6_9METZ|nr:hypothetical protein LOD99_2041 [Oopsacas minuta]